MGRAAVAALAPGRQEGRLADRRASEAGGAGSGRLTVGAGAAQQAEPAESARSTEASRSHGAGATAQGGARAEDSPGAAAGAAGREHSTRSRTGAHTAGPKGRGTVATRPEGNGAHTGAPRAVAQGDGAGARAAGGSERAGRARPPAGRAESREPTAERPALGAAGAGLADGASAGRRGAGGTGLPGRGGIEGEPIPLDSDNPRFNDYLEQVRRRIQANWVYPCLKSGQNCEYREATLEIEFGILKDGRLQFVELVRKSEYEVYDEYATNAIKLASPFPPVPASMMSTTKAGSAGVPIRARFVYLIVKSSLTNLLH